MYSLQQQQQNQGQVQRLQQLPQELHNVNLKELNTNNIPLSNIAYGLIIIFICIISAGLIILYKKSSKIISV